LEQLLDWIDAIGTPVLAVVAYLLWQIKTNELPHIYERLGHIEGAMGIDKEDK